MNLCTAEELIAFEQRIVKRFADGELPFLVHLSGGNEQQLIDIFRDIRPNDWVLASHRGHYHALLKGLSQEWLEAQICEGRSMFLYSRDKQFLTSAILAGTCGIGVGLALAAQRSGSQSRVWVFLGDGAEENGAFYEAALYAEAHQLPVTFIIEDNGRQVDTEKVTRRGQSVLTNKPLDHLPCVYRYEYTPTFPHGGVGIKPGSVKFQFEIVSRYASEA